MDAPPTSLEVGGASYKINVDYRVWLLVQEQLRELFREPKTSEESAHNLGVIADMEALVFGGVLKDEDPYEVLAAMASFLVGYPEPPVNGSAPAEEPTFSFSYDLNYIILAIRNQSGIDLSYHRKEPFHWWEFLLEFQTLSGDSYFSRLSDIRGYKDTSKHDGKKAHQEAMRLKQRYRLPYVSTIEERLAAEAFEKAMGG